MPRMSTDDFAHWRNLIEVARENQKYRRIQWDRNVRHIKRPADCVEDEDVGDIEWGEAPPNLLRKFVHTRLAANYTDEPEIDVIPESVDMLQDATGQDMSGVAATQAAQMQEKIVNDMYRRTLQGREDMDTVVDTICFGIGVKAHGYHTDTIYDPATDLAQYAFGRTTPGERDDKHEHMYRMNMDGDGITTSDGKDQHTHTIKRGFVNPAGDSATEHMHELHPAFPKNDVDNRMMVIGAFRNMSLIGYDDPAFTYSDRISSEQPWGQSVKPWMFIMDLDARRLPDARWAAYAQYKSVKELKADKRFKNTKDLDGAVLDDIEMETSDLLHYRRLADLTQSGVGTSSLIPGINDDPDDRRILLWTVFIKKDPVLAGDTRDHKVLCMVEDYEYPLYYEDNPYKDIDGQPYIPISTLSWNEPIVGQWPPDDLQDWLALVQEYLSVRAAINRQTKSEGKNNSLLDSQEHPGLAERIATADTNEIILVPGLGKTLRETKGQVLVPIPVSSVTNDLLTLRRELKQEIREQSGQNEISRGSPLPSKRTATEVQGLMRGAQTGEGARKIEIARFVGWSAQIYGSMIQQFYDGPNTAVSVMNPQGGNMAVPFDRKMIQRRFRYELREGSTTPQSKEMRRQQQMAFTGQFMQALQFLLGTFPQLANSIRAEGILQMWQDLAAQYDIPGLATVFAPAPNQPMMPQQGQPNINPAQGSGAPAGGGGGGGGANPQLISAGGGQQLGG